MPPEPAQQDLTRLNRAQRRDFKKRTHINVLGRNLPYVQSIYGSYENFSKLREEEIKKDLTNKQ